MVEVTILNSMAGREFEQALDQHVSWDIEILDLKDAIFGKNIAQLTEDQAADAAILIRERGLSVYCFSTGLFHGDIELGEKRFREDYLDKVDYVIELGGILQPDMIRLLSARTSRRAEIEDSVEYIRTQHPWLIPLYAEAIHRLYESGFDVTIENEVGGCIFSNPEEITDFFEELDCGEEVCFTWDVQNLWQMGIYPTMEVYNKLKDLIGYYHLKGGQSGDGAHGSPLRWRSSLEDASWPVVEITRQAVMDGVCEVICLNPSHGEQKEGYDYSNIVERDLDFIRGAIPEVE
ncbi:TIM barrel protein [Candidatus Poribacteria bacterium]